MKQYKIQNIKTGEYLKKGSDESFGKKGSIWLSYPKFNIDRCVSQGVAIKVITYELKETDYDIF